MRQRPVVRASRERKGPGTDRGASSRSGGFPAAALKQAVAPACGLSRHKGVPSRLRRALPFIPRSLVCHAVLHRAETPPENPLTSFPRKPPDPPPGPVERQNRMQC